MKRARFLIPSLALAGLGRTDAAVATPGAPQITGSDDPNQLTIAREFHLDHLYTLAGHSSHSSHASHASHSSGSGGGYYPSTPSYSPPAYVPPVAPAPQPLFSPTPKPLPGHTELFNQIVQKVQLGLKAYGYYSGVIDGAVGPGMRDSLNRFQKDYNLKVTGTITPEVLDTLRVAAR